MAIGSVTINHSNRNQGSFAGVEKKFLFTGPGSNSDNDDQVLSLNGDSDLDALLGASASLLKTQLLAARVNAGNQWLAWAIPTAGDWADAVNLALEKPHDLEPEAVVVCTPVTEASQIKAAQAKMVDVNLKHGLFLTAHLCVAGIDAASESWAQALARIRGLVSTLVAHRVSVTALLHGNDLGVVAGRLCHTGARVADTPMRNRTGSLVNLGDSPVDKDQQPLTMAHISDLATARISVPQWHAGQPGMYWADHPLLDKAGGDFQVYEHLRILDYVARWVRVLALAKIGDRSLNGTPKSMAFHTSYFMRPLREASHEVIVDGEPFPRRIQSPQPEHLIITWATRTKVDIYIKVRPLNCPKDIGINLMLDLNPAPAAE